MICPRNAPPHEQPNDLHKGAKTKGGAECHVIKGCMIDLQKNSAEFWPYPTHKLNSVDQRQNDKKRKSQNC